MTAVELRAGGVDFSFAPVLDLGRGVSTVIGDRAFHHDPDVVTMLARAFLAGMRDAGMGGVGKHFPGHGGVVADSHTCASCRWPLVRGSSAAATSFPSSASPHRNWRASCPRTSYTNVWMSAPQGFSRRWIGDVLRGELGFQGIVFSDDLDMAAATTGGDHLDRATCGARSGLRHGSGVQRLARCNRGRGRVEDRSGPGADGANGKDARSWRTVVRATGVRCGVSARGRRDLVAGSGAGTRIGRRSSRVKFRAESCGGFRSRSTEDRTRRPPRSGSVARWRRRDAGIGSRNAASRH